MIKSDIVKFICLVKDVICMQECMMMMSCLVDVEAVSQ